MVTLCIKDETTSGTALADAFAIEVPSSCSLREVIALRVREEVARQNGSNAEMFRTLNSLYGPSADSPVAGGVEKPERIDWEIEADRAIDLFTRGRYLVIIDDRQQEDLDAPIQMNAETTVKFIRLVPLIGG